MTCPLGDKLGASEGEVDELKRILIFCKSPHSVAEMMELLGRGSRDKFLMTILKPALNKGFISERLKSSADGEHLEYWFKKPSPTGELKLGLTALELLDKLAQLIPPPRKHRHHYHGVLAPNSPSRKQVTAHAGKRLKSGEALASEENDEINQASSNEEEGGGALSLVTSQARRRSGSKKLVLRKSIDKKKSAGREVVLRLRKWLV